MRWFEPALIRSAIRWGLCAVFALASVCVRVVCSAATELRGAEQQRASGDLDAAIVHYRRAARWYAPLSPYHVRALGRLLEIGRSAERAGDSELALSAYRAVRGAILATRSFYVPEPGLLRAANLRIAALMAVQPAPPIDAGKTRAQLEREHLQLLQSDPGPKLGWTLVLLLGFATWTSAAFAFTMRAIDGQDRFVAREAKRCGALIVLGFGLFALGMSLA